MIISASYKTDIPTFYGDWFINRLNVGYCKMVNPYGGQIYTVSLKREDVDGFVFWTKNLGPFLDKLPLIKERGFPFMIQYAINGYPRELETSVVDAKRSIEHIKQVHDLYGPRVPVWRYDTIIFTSLTPIDFHLRNFERIAGELEGFTDEVVVSFAQIYRKTKRNVDRAAKKHGFTWHDPEHEVKFKLAEDLAAVARSCGMQLTMCSQRQFLAPGVEDARCLDARRLSDIAGKPVTAKLKGNRADCGCYAARDIGAYNTCPHGCVYCYAVSNSKTAQERYKKHDPEGEFLFPPAQYSEPESSNTPTQLSLF